jgi:fructose-1,6-bisphosphatase/inositol monophosphatase family enzyme
VTVDISAFLVAAALAARQVGVVARRLQGQVANEGKDEPGHANDDDYVRRQRAAKTAVDEMAQDILITALAPHLPKDNALLDGEEDTPGKALLPAPSGDYVLVLDPIDGTLIYLEGRDTYSVNIGLLHKGELAAALIYYPGLDVAYWTDGRAAYGAADFALSGMAGAKPMQLAAQPAKPSNVFVYYRVAAEVKQALAAAGYQCMRSFQSDFGADPVAGMFAGQVAVAVLEEIQVRDVIHVAILTKAGARLTDWQGQPINWPLRGGAMPKSIISGWPLPPELLTILQPYAT